MSSRKLSQKKLRIESVTAYQIINDNNSLRLLNIKKHMTVTFFVMFLFVTILLCLYPLHIIPDILLLYHNIKSDVFFHQINFKTEFLSQTIKFNTVLTHIYIISSWVKEKNKSMDDKVKNYRVLLIIATKSKTSPPSINNQSPSLPLHPFINYIP